MKYIKTRNTNILVISLVALILWGCKSDVEIIKTEIDKNFEIDLTSELRPIASTMEFYLYSVPENYWYPEGTTPKEVIEDELKLGYKRLGKLDNLINSIHTEDNDIATAVDTLHNRIVAARKNIRKAQKAMEQVNSIFGFGLYGGMSTLYDFGTMLGNSNSKDDDEMKIPKEVLQGFEDLKEAIRMSNIRFLTSVHEFEENSIAGRKLSADELSSIRFYIKQKIKDNVKLYYTGSDTTDRNEATQRLLDGYDTFTSLKN